MVLESSDQGVEESGDGKGNDSGDFEVGSCSFVIGESEFVKGLIRVTGGNEDEALKSAAAFPFE